MPTSDDKSTLSQIWSALDGQKTHFSMLIGAVAITWAHFSGQHIPGVSVDDSNWLQTDFALLGVMCGRDAVRKLEDALGGDAMIQAVAAIIEKSLKARQAAQGDPPKPAA